MGVNTLNVQTITVPASHSAVAEKPSETQDAWPAPWPLHPTLAGSVSRENGVPNLFSNHMVGDKILAVMGQLMNSSPRSTPGSQHCVTSTPRSLPSVRNIIAEKEARKGGKEQQGKQNEAVCSKLKQDATQDLFKKRQRRGTANQVAK